MKTFKELGLSDETLKVLEHKGFEEPTPIQEKIIPLILGGDKDVVGQAQTGTGKTAAFGLPMIELMKAKKGQVQALVLTPTRELAVQVAEEISSLKGKRNLSVVPIYGGQSYSIQLRSLQRGVDIVVGTPGRIIDHINRKTLKLENISYLVLDEADEMLNMGFIDEVKEIMEHTNSEKRTMLFSATISNEIMLIAKKYMKEHEIIRESKDQLTVSATDQIYFEVSESDKFEALCRIIDIEEDFYGLIFCRTKIDVDMISNHLIERGYDTDALHGDISQTMREKILGKFKSRKINILVATDVAARGIDVQDLTHVINYSLPQDPESYVHRIGRTGRAGKEGNAVTFVTPQEYSKLQFIKKIAKTDIRKATLPKIKDVIKTKKQKIKNDLEGVMASPIEKEYINLSKELLSFNDPEIIISALLQYTFQDELVEKNYVEIKERSGSNFVDNKGKTRLFVTQGKKDGLNPKKLISFIQEKCSVSNDKIKDILILDSFSFVSLPFVEAEIVLQSFKTRQKGSKLHITKATEKKERK